MTTAALLPPVPRLPHDPLRIVLDRRVGWQLARPPVDAEIAPLDEALTLAPLPRATRFLADPSGSFGGLTPPAYVTLTSDGIILLLDRRNLVLKRFDPCTCDFVPLNCIAGAGTQPRRLSSPGGIVAACGNLYVCDTGNRRVQVFGLRGLVLRALWLTPGQADVAQPWTPVDVDADAHGHIYVADPANGCVHVFQATGRWLRSLKGLGSVQHLAVDCEGRLYLHLQGEERVYIVDVMTGARIQEVTRADEVASRFAPLPFAVTHEGRLKFVTPCVALFDETGGPVSEGEALAAPSFESKGQILIGPLDSKLYQCLWDRIELEGDFPDHTCVQAFVCTAETALPIDLVEQLAPDAWRPCTPLGGNASARSTWDALLRAAPGRFLWLRLDIDGDGYVSPRIRRACMVFPRVSLRRYLPGVFGMDPVGADFTDRFLAIFDREFRNIEHTIDQQAHLLDPLSAPSDSEGPQHDFLSWLATWIGVTLDRGWPEERRRRYLKQVGKLLPMRGTLEGLQRHLQLYLGLDREVQPCVPACGPCTTTTPVRWQPPQLILEHYRLRRWMFLDHGRLGEQARLWGEGIVNRSQLGGTQSGSARIGQSQLITSQDPWRDPFHVYAHKFTVFAPAAVLRSNAARRGLERLIRSERPGHTAYQVVYVQPRFRIGIQSMIGFDSAVGAYPAGVTLGDARLGKASVLKSEHTVGDTVSVGDQARIGSTTKLS